MRADLTRLIQMNIETWILCTVTYLLMTLNKQNATSAELPLPFSAAAAHTVTATVFMRGSVHCLAALPHPMHYLSVKMKRRGVGLGIL